MIFSFKSNKARKIIEAKITEGNQYLSNNYRDLAKSCYEEMKELLQKHSQNGDLNQKDISALTKSIEAYSVRMSHRGHY